MEMSVDCWEFIRTKLFINTINRVTVTRVIINNKLYLSYTIFMSTGICTLVVGKPGVL